MEKQTQGKGIKTSIAKQMFQKLPIAFAHVKTGNTSIWKLTKWNPSNIFFT